MTEQNQGISELNEDDEISLVDLAATIFKHRKLLIFSVLGSAIVIVLISIISLLLPPEKSFMPNIYTAQASMLVNTSSNSRGLSSALAASGMSSLAGLAGISVGGQSYGQLAVYIAGTNVFLDSIIDKFNLIDRYKIKKNIKTESRKALKKNLSVQFAEKTGVLTLSFKDINPEFARDVVNYGVELLDARFRYIGWNKNQLKKDQLEEKLADVKVKMNRLEEEIRAFQQKYGVISVESLAAEQISTVARVRSELMMKDMEIKTYQDLAKVDDPMLRRLKSERENLAKLLDSLEKGQSNNEKLLPSQKELPKIALEYAHLKRDLMVQEAIYQLLTQQYEATKLALSGEDPIFQVLELAEAPDQKSGPSRGMICIVVIMVSFFMALFAIFIIEAIQNIKNDPEVIAKFSGGVIKKSPRAGRWEYTVSN